MLSDFIAWIRGTDGEWWPHVTRDPAPAFVMRRKINGRYEYREPTADERFAAWDEWQW